MMNLEYTQKLKKKFTPETRATLKAIVEQSGIDLDKLLVYYDAADGEQHVFYKIDKVTRGQQSKCKLLNTNIYFWSVRCLGRRPNHNEDLGLRIIIN